MSHTGTPYSAYRAAMREFVQAHGLNPADVSADGAYPSDDGRITFERVRRGPNGEPMIDHSRGRPRLMTELVEVRQVRPWPTLALETDPIDAAMHPAHGLVWSKLAAEIHR